MNRTELATLIADNGALSQAAMKVLYGDIRGARVRVQQTIDALTKAMPELLRYEAEQDARGTYLDAVREDAQ